MKMNGQIVAAVGLLGVGLFGLIALWVYSQVKRPRQTRRCDKDLVVVHRFKSQRRHRAMRPALAAPTPDQPGGDDSRWRRPGFTAPAAAPNERQPLPYYEPTAPRHVLIPRQTSMPIIPHEIVEPPRAQPRLSQRTQRSQPTALIKTLRIETQKRMDMAI